MRNVTKLTQTCIKPMQAYEKHIQTYTMLTENTKMHPDSYKPCEKPIRTLSNVNAKPAKTYAKNSETFINLQKPKWTYANLYGTYKKHYKT